MNKRLKGYKLVVFLLPRLAVGFLLPCFTFGALVGLAVGNYRAFWLASGLCWMVVISILSLVYLGHYALYIENGDDDE